jgi:GT2 family glycosyltransferase
LIEWDMSSVARVTVAVPSYNQGRFLEATLRSIFAQRVPVEVMVADGGSNDHSLHIIEGWRDQLTWFRSEPDKGQSSAINAAISHGRAPLVCWLNSDDLLLPGGLATLVATIESDPSIGVAYGGCLRIDEHGRVIGRTPLVPFSGDALSRRSIIAQPASIIRREVWEAVGGLDENLHLALDFDLWWRLHRAGFRFAHVGVDVAAARLHPAAKTIRLASEMYAECKSVVYRYHGSVPLVWWMRQPFSIAWRKIRIFKMIALVLARSKEWLRKHHGVLPVENAGR